MTQIWLCRPPIQAGILRHGPICPRACPNRLVDNRRGRPHHEPPDHQTGEPNHARFRCPCWILAGILAFPAATVIAGNKGGAGKPWDTSSSGHMSIEGARNTNGQWSPDRDHGLDRAQDRRSDSALEHPTRSSLTPGMANAPARANRTPDAQQAQVSSNDHFRPVPTHSFRCPLCGSTAVGGGATPEEFVSGP